LKILRGEVVRVLLLQSTIPGQGIVCAKSRNMRFTRSICMVWAKVIRKKAAFRAGLHRLKRMAALGITTETTTISVNKKVNIKLPRFQLRARGFAVHFS
jgi:hypothetical protein